MRTGRFAVLAALATAGALCLGSGAALAQKIIVGDASGDAGAQVTVNVSLSTGGTQVAGTQNDIGFQPQARVAAKANGKPDCVVNADIDKGATSFAFRPSGCSGDACTGIRALVLSTDNVAAIADGSVLYTCKVNIAADAANGTYALAATGVILSDPDGNAIANASGQNGTVTVGVPPVGDTPTPTVPPVVACEAPAVKVETVTVDTGATSASVPVTLLAENTAGTQNDIAFSAGARVAAKANGKPDCAVNPDIDKGATSFAFRPSGCSGDACTGIRALVLSTDNVAVISSGSILYTCNVTVASGVSGLQALTTSGVILSDPDGNAIDGAHGCDGGVQVGVGPVEPTNTPTPPEEATATPTTPPVVATSTPTVKAPATNTPGGGGTVSFKDHDGCQIATAGSSGAAWMLLIPAVGLLVLRRRSR